MSAHILRAALLCGLFVTMPAMADGPAAAEVETGRSIAERLCAGCHAVEGPGPSPVADAPPFAILHQRWPVAHLAEALAEGIVVGHGSVTMPEFVLQPDEIDDLIAFLESLETEAERATEPN